MNIVISREERPAPPVKSVTIELSPLDVNEILKAYGDVKSDYPAFSTTFSEIIKTLRKI